MRNFNATGNDAGRPHAECLTPSQAKLLEIVANATAAPPLSAAEKRFHMEVVGLEKALPSPAELLARAYDAHNGRVRAELASTDA